MPEYLAGKTPSIEQLNTWIESFHTNGFFSHSQCINT